MVNATQVILVIQRVPEDLQEKYSMVKRMLRITRTDGSGWS